MNKGYLTEIVFINNLNGKRFCEVNVLLQELLLALYPNIKTNDLIMAYKYGQYAKADIVIVVRGIRRGISIKTGGKNSVHLERIDIFTKYLEKIGFKEIDKLKRYLYSDGTTNNTGKNRISADEYRENHLEEIEKINVELEEVKQLLIKRFLIKTDINYHVKVDAIILGDVDDFMWATSDEVLKYLEKKKIDSTGINVSGLFLQNWDKNLKYNPKYEYCREYVQVKWYSLFDDLIQIMCNRNIDVKTINEDYSKKESLFIKLLRFVGLI